MDNNTLLFVINIVLSAGLVLMAFLFKKYVPKKRNHLYGYRTRLSMQSEGAWLLANRYSSNLMFKLAVGISVIHLAVLLLWNGVYALSVLCGLWVVMCPVMIFRTERLLKRESGDGETTADYVHSDNIGAQVQKTYKSKIDLWLLILLVAGFGVPLIYMTVREPHWIGPVIWLPLTIFVISSVTTIRYVIDKDMLLIRSVGFKSVIPIRSIRRVKASNSILASPAASLGRLEIFYNKYDSVLVSPKDKQAFINDLKTINPEILSECLSFSDENLL